MKLLGSLTELVKAVFTATTGGGKVTVQPDAATSVDATMTIPNTSGASDTVALEAASQTLTNKTITAGSNTISGLTHGSEVDDPSSGVHGVTGSVVGTSDSQTLTNKTMTAAGNTISGLAHGSEVDNPSSGVHGVTGSVVGTSDSQTLTNKTIDGDDNTVQDLPLTAIKTDAVRADKFFSGATTTGAPIATKDVPAGDVVGTSDTQTLTGKTIDGDDNTVQDLPLTAIKTDAGRADKFFHGATGTGAASATKDVPSGDVVGTSDTQTLSAKTLTSPNVNGGDINLGTAGNTTKIVVSKDTNANLTALTREQASVYYDTTNDTVVYDDGTNLQTLAATATATPSAEGTVTSFTPIAKSAVNSVSSDNYTVTDTDGYDTILMSTGATPRTVLLPAATNNTGRRLVIIKTDVAAGTVTIDGNGAETISGESTQVLYSQYAKMEIVCDGANWVVVNVVEDGTYTPTITNITISNSPTATLAVTANVTSFQRTGNRVTIYGAVAINPNAAAIGESGTFEIDLPIARLDGNFTVSVEQGGGAGNNREQTSARITPLITSEKFRFHFIPESSGNETLSFICSYRLTN